MAEASRSGRVTITLGGSGQVVKRAPASDGVFSESHPAVGRKRSVRDRLGSDGDGAQYNRKRQREDSAANGVGDTRLGKGDLRFKLMRKNVLKQVQSDGKQNGADLRDTLSRENRPSTSDRNIRQHMPEPTRLHIYEPKDASLCSRIPSTRGADALAQIDVLRNLYSPWTLDRLRRRSPDATFRTSRGLSPRRSAEELPKRPLMRTYDDVRPVSYRSKDILEPSRPMSSSQYLTKQTASSGPVKAGATLLGPPPPSSSIIQRSSYTGEEHLTVDGLLHSLGLEKYAIYFRAEEIDMPALRQMGDHDLKELGVPMGPRKKILLALQPRSRRPMG